MRNSSSRKEKFCASFQRYGEQRDSCVIQLHTPHLQSVNKELSTTETLSWMVSWACLDCSHLLSPIHEQLTSLWSALNAMRELLTPQGAY